jgi:Zn finger protein HypA/HybF involved in hydrogenase expression
MEKKITDMPNFRDLILKCQDCGTDFLLQSSEQLFYFKRGLAMPKRCPECRQRRRIVEGDGTK